MKRHKDPAQDLNTNSEAQVFVLPPDLLEKLGIQLTNFTHPSENLAENSIVCQSLNDDVKDLPGSDDGSSILETANLMKQSVFMSPTFVSTTATETTSEQILTNVAETQNTFKDGNELFISNNDAVTSNTDQIEFVNNNINTTYTLQSEKFEKFPTINEFEVKNYSGDLIFTNNINLNELKKTVDDHADEAYASDGSNGHTRTSTEITKNNLEEEAEQKKPSNKIKILSEQIINHSELNTIKKKGTKNSSSCFLIPVNSIVTGKAIKNHSNNQSMQQTVQDELCNTQYHDKIDEIRKNDINYMETVINKETLVEDLIHATHRGSVVTEDIKKQISHKVKKDGFGQNKREMIVDIDKQIFPNNDDSKTRNKDEKLIVRTMSDNTKEIMSNTENSLSKSKLCIQGVEKPGGKQDNKINTVHKTYQRTNIKKHIPELPYVDYTNTVDSNTLSDVVIDLDDISICGYRNANKFCICSDFGQLANYGSDNDYEHLHFNNKNNVGCKLETLFSIYDDTSVLRELNITEDIDLVDDIIETNQHNICWLSFICEDNDDAVELAILETKMDASNSTPGQPRRSTRKRKSTATEQVTENLTPKSEKTIKCGACSLVLSEVEWNKHKDSEHNLIAWKDGQTIDLKNKGLLKKLRLKLGKLGVLRCTICNTNIKQLTKFVQHIEKCIKRKVENTSNANDNEKLTKEVPKKKDLTPELLQRTRRSSRNLNIFNDLSETAIDNAEKPKINPDKQIQKLNSTETQSLAIPITETAKFVERDGGAYKSTRTKSIDLVSSKPVIKSSDIEESSRFTRQSKKIDCTSKSTGVEVTTKSTKKFINISSKATEIKANSREKDKDTPKSIERSTIDAVSNPSNMKETSKAKSKDTQKSRGFIDVSSEVTKNKDTPKADIKETSRSEDTSKATSKYTPKSKGKSIDVSSKVTEIKDYTKAEGKDYSMSTRRSVDVSTKAIIIKVTSKAELKDTPKLTGKPNKVSSKLSEVQEVPQKLTRKSTDEEEITDNFVSHIPVKQVKNLEIPNNNLKRKSVNDVASAKITKKTIDAEQKCKQVDATPTSAAVEICAKNHEKSIDAQVSLNVTKKYTRVRAPKENTEGLTPTPTIGFKNIDSPSKFKTKSQDVSPSKCKSLSIANKTTQLQAEKEKDLNPQSKSEVMGIEVKVPSKSPHESVSMEIVTTAQSAKIATSDNDNATKSNAQVVTVEVSSNSDSGNSVAHSIPNQNSIANSEANNPQPVEDIFVTTIKQEKLPECGVCKQAVDDSQWLEHIAREHDYLAWREDQPPLDLQDDEVIRAHLYAILKANGGLKCSKCSVVRKYVKSYLSHLSNCNGIKDEQSQMNVSSTIVDGMDVTQDFVDVPQRSYSRTPVRNALSQYRTVVCGVCSEKVTENKWINHIRMEHKYLAWKSDEPPLNVDDEVEVKIFLQNISKYNGGLICSKCGVVRLYVKKWMDHEATCKGDAGNNSLLLDNTDDSDSTLNKTNVSTTLVEIEILPEIIKCGKCGKEMPKKGWIDHIETEHNYLAWIEGQPPLEENNTEAVSAYLHAMVKKRGALYCVKCGVSRKYPKAFLTHISACEISGFKREDFYVEVSDAVKPGEYECAVCHEKGPLKDFKKHSMDKHYNVAWMAGEIPINLKNPYAVEKYIKEYRTKHNLVCKVCGTTRVSCYGFYAHILTCGKAEDELEHLMNMCDICNNKYLCIYRNQHMAMHRDQQIKKELKEKKVIMAEEEKNMEKANVEEGEPTGKRRAAEKAKKVMEKYTSNTQDGSHVCLSCHIGFDNATQLEDHVCTSQEEEANDSDVSVKMEGQEESDDDMEDVDSSISDEEADSLTRKRHTESLAKIVLPFKVRDVNYYLAKSFDNFCALHYTSESLFNNWRRNDYDILSEEEASRYLPWLTESCKLRIGDEWETYKRFEAKKKRDITLFTGATIRCMQWVPQNIDDEKEDFYLAVACFQHADCPRYGKEELPQHPGMLQIWRIGRFMSTPKFELGLAHDYGTIWAMDWCPSGARDIVPSEEEGPFRLGLLAIACSNGCAYILSVPRFHNELEVEPTICKLKPVAELRLSMNPQRPPFRAGYQATSISWSPQKDHEVVMVGYSDGTTALYNLNTASPFLKSMENSIHIFYPFHDALSENSPITGVALTASTDLCRIVGGFASSSVTGATMSGWPGVAPVVRSHLAASSILYTPNWPAALLCSDDVLTMKSTNEMEWWGGGRRLGGACAAGGCARCGRVCLAAPPFVRVLRAHPCYPELKKQIVATMKMVPIAQKRKLKLVNDDLGMIVEPLTYDETIKKYGLEFKTLSKTVRNVASKLSANAEQCPERFPLSDMPSAAFCPSNEYHNRLAIATHAGFVFIMSA